jgi:rod shape-determining protein MreC
VFFFLVLAFVPLSRSLALKSSVYSFLEKPIRFSRNAAQLLLDLSRFQKNAEELRRVKTAANTRIEDYQIREALAENDRLTRLLELRKIQPANGRLLYARVIGRSPSAWNRVFLIDKGVQEGVRVNQPVLSDRSLVGKIIEAGPSVSKVLLMTDPNSRIGVLLQRTRQQGVLYGTLSGECRIKYLSMDAEVRKDDVVETAGFGGFFPKGLLIGTVTSVRKEPGQMYQVAETRPATDLSRIEEVACLV